MGPGNTKRRRGEEEKKRPAKKVKKSFKKQKNYHSSSESDDEMEDSTSAAVEFAPVSMDDSEDEDTTSATKKSSLLKTIAAEESPVEEGSADGSNADEDVVDLDDTVLSDEGLDDDDDFLSGSDAGPDSVTTTNRKVKKRNDPSAFADSLSRILSSKLTTSKRSDPVLSRSADAATANRELNDARLEEKAKRKLRAEKRQALEKGRVRDVLGLDTPHVSTSSIQEQERRLKKTAQRGVVKLFNAVRAAQVQGEKAREDARLEGVVGMGQREERVTEMSKKGFLDLIAQGGKKVPAMNAQEA